MMVAYFNSRKNLAILNACFFVLLVALSPSIAAEDDNATKIQRMLAAGQNNEAVELAMQLVREGDRDGQFALGNIIIYNHADSRDDVLFALELFEKSANQGKIEALNTLVTVHSTSEYGVKDFAKALKFAQMSADLGNLIGQYEIGYRLANGVGTKRDDKKAVEYYLQSANQGYAEAQHNLGFMYFEGRGIKKNNHQAEKWYRSAAMQGKAISMRAIGLMHADGDISFKDPSRSLAWLLLAKHYGLDWIDKDIKALEDSLSPDMQAASKKLYTRCVETNLQDCE